MKIPYGVADFHSLRTTGQLYVDRTAYLRTVEELGKALLFLRPRRFGKSLWLSTLANYYDLRTAEEHSALFGDLAIGQKPTPLAHNYFVLHWDFSKINPDPPSLGIAHEAGSRPERIARAIYDYLGTSLETFRIHYRDHLPEIPPFGEDPLRNLELLLAVIRQTPHRLYLLIDEYDNFANEVLTANQDDYEDLVQSDGPFKFLFKWIKAAMGEGGIDRLFITGVSPMVMSDVTSGINILENIYLDAELNTLCGFTGEEVGELLTQLHTDSSGERQTKPTWDVDEARGMLRSWYNGYHFVPTAITADNAVYNPTLVLYFLKHLQRTGAYPRQMLDTNLAADEAKLDYLTRVASGTSVLLDLVRKEKPLEIETLIDRFTLGELLQPAAQDATFLGAYLYYFGMLTLAGETLRRTLLLTPPNEVVHGLYLERVRRLLLPHGTDRNAASQPSWDLMEGKPIEPLLDFIEHSLFPTFSNRDATWANELTIKTVFLTLLWNGTSYLTDSEPELEHRYADLCLLRRPDARASNLRDLLFEFKRLPLSRLGLSGEAIRDKSRQDLETLPEVQGALGQAESQLRAYRGTLNRRHGKDLALDAYAVIALGFERLVARKVS